MQVDEGPKNDSKDSSNPNEDPEIKKEKPEKYKLTDTDREFLD